ncbi:MAG TPA: type II toxin-antitoxin system VapC family toxin [Gammaproteobacteria bacterium]|nr:type II toxin-antitoxin system VapC family toxin [Gammaproteobacteria bacterium]
MLDDTSIWIEYFRSHNNDLAALLSGCQVLMHPYVLGELACGNLANRAEILQLMGALPQAPAATDKEVRYFIEQHALMGKGIGYIDVHLLASVALHGSTMIWTRDKRLNNAAETLSMAYH